MNRPIGGTARRHIEVNSRVGVKDCMSDRSQVSFSLSGRKKFDVKPGTSSTFRPSLRQIAPVKHTDHPTGTRRLPEPRGNPASLSFLGVPGQKVHYGSHLMKGTEPGARSFEHLMGVKVRPAHMERSYEASVEDLMASKLRLDTRLDMRNQIPYTKQGDKMYATPEYCPGYHKLLKGKNKNGLVAGSNWGFSKATQSTREDAKIFGRDISLLWRHNPSIPEVVQLSVEYLEQRGKTPGLFGIGEEKGNAVVTTFEDEEDRMKKMRQKELRQIRARVDRAQIHLVNWNKISDAHVVGGLLIEFFSELEPPLLTYAQHDRFIEAQNCETELDRVAALRSVVGALPVAARTALAFFIRFCLRLVQPDNLSSNGLSREALAERFAPIFMRPLGHSIEDEQNLAKRLKERNTKGAKGSPASVQVLLTMMGVASREIFQSVSLRKYDQRSGQRVPYTQKLKARILNEERGEVDDLADWESRTGLFTITPKEGKEAVE